MKIKELIKELEMFDKEMEVFCSREEDDWYEPLLKLDKIKTYSPQGSHIVPALML